jgi:hypothetical protein
MKEVCFISILKQIDDYVEEHNSYPQYLVIGRDKSYFVKTIKNNLIININRTMSFKC